jgi:hypothetical protein
VKPLRAWIWKHNAITSKIECTAPQPGPCILHAPRRLAISRISRYARPVFPGKPDRPYFESWLKRTRKQLAGSGRLSEIALILSREEGRTAQDWSSYLREVLEEEVTPSLDLLTRVDAILAKPVRAEIPLETPPLF